MKLFCLSKGSGAVYIFKLRRENYTSLGNGKEFVGNLRDNEVILVDIDGSRFGFSDYFVKALHPKYGQCDVRLQEIKNYCVRLDED